MLGSKNFGISDNGLLLIEGKSGYMVLSRTRKFERMRNLFSDVTKTMKSDNDQDKTVLGNGLRQTAQRGTSKESILKKNKIVVGCDQDCAGEAVEI